MARFIYLHGLASSPGSRKATAFKKGFEANAISLVVPDLENGDFQRLSLSGQMKIIDDCLDSNAGNSIGLIGSSMGGYLAALTAQKRKEVSAIYLMAPGFNFIKRWRDRIQGQFKGLNAIPHLINVFHYRYNKYMPLSTDIFLDAEKWEQQALDRNLPTRIVHGIDDDTVSISESRNFAKAHPWCQLEELNSDHTLLSHIDWIVEDSLAFFRRENLF